MRKYFFVLIYGIILPIYCNAQRIDSLIHLANVLRSEGKYHRAIIEYKKALNESNSILANYELAYTYVMLSEHKKAIKYCNRVLKTKSEKQVDALVIKGSALDDMGKSRKSISLYKSAIKQFPDKFLLHYNLGITYYNNDQLPNAKEQFIKSIEIDKLQANSHYALGFLLNEIGYAAESMMSLYFFLMLEPNTDRSIEVHKLLIHLWKQNIEIDSTLLNSVKVVINPKKNYNHFQSIDLLVSSIYASNSGINQYKKNEYEKLVSNTYSFFNLLGNYKGIDNDFRMNLYINFFNDLFNANQVEPFCYYISATSNSSIATHWLEVNRDKIKSFSEWTNNWFLKKKESQQTE